MNLIYIYQDYVHNNYPLFNALTQHFGADHVQWITAQDIIENNILDNNPRAFFMPGGADLYYCERLNGTGNKKIRHYVENGGTYVGICAGAYYACRDIAWLKGTYDEISGDRELTFFNGHATGPIGEYTRFEDEHRIDADLAMLIDDQGNKTPTFYWGGPLFVGDGTFPTDIDIIMRYADLPGQPPAIIQCPVGNGRTILSSTHIEIGHQDIAQIKYPKHRDYDHYQNLAKKLAKDDDLRLNLWNKILQML